MSILSHLITCYHILSTLSHVLPRIYILYIVCFAPKFDLFLNVVSYHRNVDFVTSYHLLSHLIHLITCFTKDIYFVHSLFCAQICSFFERSLLSPKCQFCHILSLVITSYPPYHMFYQGYIFCT